MALVAFLLSLGAYGAFGGDAQAAPVPHVRRASQPQCSDLSALGEALSDAEPTFVLIEGLPAPGLSKTRAKIETVLRATHTGPVLEADAIGRHLEVDVVQLDRAFTRGATRVLVLREEQGGQVWLRAWHSDSRARQSSKAYVHSDFCLSSEGPPNLSDLAHVIVFARNNSEAVSVAPQSVPDSRAGSRGRSTDDASAPALHAPQASRTVKVSKRKNVASGGGESPNEAQRKSVRVKHALATGGAVALASAGLTGVAVHIAFVSSRSQEGDAKVSSSNLRQQRYMFVSAGAALVGVATGVGMASVMRATKFDDRPNREIELTNGPAGTVVGAGVRASF